MLALPDGPEFAEVFWGALKIGAVAVPVNDRLSAPEYEFLLNDSRAPAVVVGEEDGGRRAGRPAALSVAAERDRGRAAAPGHAPRTSGFSTGPRPT